MTTPIVEASPIASAVAAKITGSTAMVLNIAGYEINLLSVMIVAMLAGILFLFYRIQRSGTLDFADMITKDGKSVSLTKVLQLVGGITATWVIIKLTSSGVLTESVFGLYLTYVGAIEGYSKYVAAKYGYAEKSVKDAQPSEDAADPSLKPPKG
jgi:FtsH-binding integral membrane protein